MNKPITIAEAVERGLLVPMHMDAGNVCKALTITIRPFTISDELPLCRWIRGSYWGGWQSVEQIRTALNNSLVFAAEIEGDMVGFIRIVTDYATFSAITDFWVEPEHRKQGVGRALMEHVLKDTGVPETICVLTTRDAGEFYRKFGFIPIGGQCWKRDPSR